jgi:hypothetical protein
VRGDDIKYNDYDGGVTSVLHCRSIMTTLGTWMDLKRRKEHKRGPRKLLRRCDVQGGLGCSWLWSKVW